MVMKKRERRKNKTYTHMKFLTSLLTASLGERIGNENVLLQTENMTELKKWKLKWQNLGTDGGQ